MGTARLGDGCFTDGWPELRTAMCRNIKTLRNPITPPTQEEVTLAALQYVRKVSGIPFAFSGEPGCIRRRCP